MQFVRIFGSFTVQKGFDDADMPIYESVPARYGDMSRQVGHILKDNSENTLNTVPMISCYINNLEMNPDLRRYPQFEDQVNVIEKHFDEDQHKYVDEPGQSYTVTRYQPVPYVLRMDVDIWTSNTDQKLQLLEQILVLFNPSINLHTNQNVLDWTSLSYCELISTNWSSRTLPSGADNVIDIATLTFEMPIFINPPVKVNRMNVIHTILTNLHTLDAEDFDSWDVTVDTGAESSFITTTLENYWINYENGLITLLDEGGDDKGGDGSVLNWKEDVFSNYGELRPGISQLRLRFGDDITDPSNDIIGTIDYDGTNDQRLVFTLDTDTLPANTQTNVNAIVNPQVNYPGDGTLAAATSGQRYLVLSEVASGGAWGTITASENDIIEYNGSAWVVSFDASANSSTEYVTNLTTNKQYQWNGSYWADSSQGVYRQGWFRIYV